MKLRKIRKKKMTIENMVNGVSVVCHDEGLDDIKNPAKVVISHNGKPVATLLEKKIQIRGADGGYYPSIKFEQKPDKK